MPAVAPEGCGGLWGSVVLCESLERGERKIEGGEGSEEATKWLSSPSGGRHGHWTVETHLAEPWLRNRGMITSLYRSFLKTRHIMKLAMDFKKKPMNRGDHSCFEPVTPQSRFLPSSGLPAAFHSFYFSPSPYLYLSKLSRKGPRSLRDLSNPIRIFGALRSPLPMSSPASISFPLCLFPSLLSIFTVVQIKHPNRTRWPLVQFGHPWTTQFGEPYF